MAYQKQEWIDGETVVAQAHMEHIEAGIVAVEAHLDGVATTAQESATDLAALDSDIDAVMGRTTALEAKSAVLYVNNSEAVIPDGVTTIPGGWTPVGDSIPAVTYSGSGWTFNTPGVYLIAMSGSYRAPASTANLEYHLVLNGLRIFAAFGAGGDISSRSGVTIASVGVGAVLQAEYVQKSGGEATLRQSEFNSVSIAQIH